MSEEVNTPNLILRSWQESDADVLYELCQDEAFGHSGLWAYPSPDACREAIARMKAEPGSRAIVSRENGKVIGLIGLADMNRYDGYMELEYAVEKNCRGRGYASEAVRCMVDYGFGALGLLVIAAWVRSHNQASCRVLEKCGFTFEGRLKKHARDGSDTLCYSILREEWEKKTL